MRTPPRRRRAGIGPLGGRPPIGHHPRRRLRADRPHASGALPRLLVALLTLLWWAAAAAQPGLDPPPASLRDGSIQGVPVRDIAVEDVVVGQQGYGLTAGPSDRLERFPVEVLAVLWDAGPGFPLVLVRAGGPFIEASGGVAAGMSGSPVYLETDGGDALLGAIGYVFPNADHRVALVTPIVAMRAALGDTAAGDQPHGAPTAAGPEGSGGAPYVAGFGRAVPVATPILMAGADPRALALLQPLFRDATVQPFATQTGGFPEGREPSYRPTPGGALAVTLVRGDVTLAAVGTLTTVDDDRVLAFGHPFLGIGPVDLPLAPAFVSAIVASSEVPFKLANVGSTMVGAIQQDRPGALAGRLGAASALLPVTLRVTGAGGSASYRFEVAADERLYPVLVAVGTLELLDRHLQRTTGGFAELAWEIGLDGGDRANVLEQVNHPDDIAFAAASLAGAPLDVLASNVFRRAPVTSLALNVRLEERQRVATIEDIVAESSVLAPGQALLAHVRLQPFRESASVRTVTVKLPADVRGEVRLSFRGGGVPRDDDEGDEEDRRLGRPRSFGELLDALREQVQNSEMVVERIDEDGDTERLARVPFPYVIEGSQELVVTVKDAAGSADGAEEGAPADDVPVDGGETSGPPPATAPEGGSDGND